MSLSPGTIPSDFQFSRTWCRLGSINHTSRQCLVDKESVRAGRSWERAAGCVPGPAGSGERRGAARPNSGAGDRARGADGAMF